jgi:hypothetical protein
MLGDMGFVQEVDLRQGTKAAHSFGVHRDHA